MNWTDAPLSATRRFFLKASPALLCGSALWLMNRIARKVESLPENALTSLTIPRPGETEIRFYDRAIAVGNPEGAIVLSTSCPHLGCRINRMEGAELVCPCHGSRFSRHGKLLLGPAGRDLAVLRFSTDRARALLRIGLTP